MYVPINICLGFINIILKIFNISFLFLMQEETEKIVETVESMNGNIQNKKNQVHFLTREVEEKEKKKKLVIVKKKKKKKSTAGIWELFFND